MTDTQPLRAAARAEAPIRRPPSRGALAWKDLRDGPSRWWLWGTLGWKDIRQRYRGSVLGPFWLTLSMAVWVLSLGFLYGHLLGADHSDFIPYLCVGQLVWALISSLITDGCQVFVSVGHVIKQIRLPFSTHVCRLVWRNLLIFGHNFLVYLLIVVVFDVRVGWEFLMMVPGLLLILANGAWISLLLGMISARFRDVPPIVGSVLQILFFLTPIVWKPEMLKEQASLVLLNPFSAFLDLVREPLLGRLAPTQSWLIALAVTVVGMSVTFAFFARFRSRIPYWV